VYLVTLGCLENASAATDVLVQGETALVFLIAQAHSVLDAYFRWALRFTRVITWGANIHTAEVGRRSKAT